MANCDKCGKPVPHNNDATIVSAVLYGGVLGAMQIFGTRARRFLPTEDCEGSPSRAQYIEGQPRDTRGYDYEPEWEERVREAFEKVQAEYGAA